MFGEACFCVICKYCGCNGLIVDDIGNFWENPETGELLEE
jgi:hypothetical protein